MRIPSPCACLGQTQTFDANRSVLCVMPTIGHGHRRQRNVKKEQPYAGSSPPKMREFFVNTTSRKGLQ